MELVDPSVVRTAWATLPAVLGRMAESQIKMTPECLVCRCIFRKPGSVTEDRILTTFYEIRHRAETGACCDLAVPDVVLPTNLGYLAMALHVESLQATLNGREYCPCLTGVQENR